VGFAHGFVVRSPVAEVLYKATDYYYPAGERSIRWDDPDLAIAWDLDTEPVVSAKDAAGSSLAAAEEFAA
jgi:dTDP-4-dehydrorhamnose 3,5-epimerase